VSCSVCGGKSHNSRTCKESKKPDKPKGRKCSICNTFGHYASTCPNKDKPVIEAPSSFSAAKQKKKELGHQLLKEKNKKVDRVEVDGLTPQKGLWLVNFKRKKIAGKIVQVKRNGSVVWKCALGALNTTPQERLIEMEYSYIQDLEPEMLNWKIIGRND
jgi:hypothetical protein